MTEGYVIQKKKKIRLVLRNKVSTRGDAEIRMRPETFILQGSK